MKRYALVDAKGNTFFRFSEKPEANNHIKNTYRWEQHLYFPSISSLHIHVRLIIGKLERVGSWWSGKKKNKGRQDGRTHIEHSSCDPDRVRRAYEVFDTLMVYTRRHLFGR